jgi:nucleoside-diphosphate-sugar epimerase
MSKFLVAGGSGFIGSHLVDLLQSKGHKVVIFDLKEPDPKWYQPTCEVVLGDVLDKDSIRAAMDGVDGIFDCSGVLGSAETFDHIEKAVSVNIFGTLNVLEVAREFDVPIVYLSLKNEWKNPYMISKRAGSEFCEMYAKYRGTRAVAIRGLNAYGPRQHWDPVRKMFPRFVTTLLKGEPIKIFGNGKQIVDMIYVRDMAETMWRAYEKEVWGTVFDSGTGVPRTVLDVANDLIKQIGGTIEHVEMRPGEPDEAVALADPSFVKQKLDYYPETEWKDGVAIAIDWYKELLKND